MFCAALWSPDLVLELLAHFGLLGGVWSRLDCMRLRNKLWFLIGITLGNVGASGKSGIGKLPHILNKVTQQLQPRGTPYYLRMHNQIEYTAPFPYGVEFVFPDLEYVLVGEHCPRTLYMKEAVDRIIQRPMPRNLDNSGFPV